MTDFAHGASAPLSSRQVMILALYGVLLWFIAAMLVRVLVPMGALDGWARALTYALIIPGTAPTIWIMQKIAGLARAQTGVATAVVTAAALMLDGVAVAWFPALYSDSVEGVLAGAAAILWGAGVGLVLGIVMGRR
jgi:hypothetical protein